MGRMLRESPIGVLAVVALGGYLGLELTEFVPLVPEITSEVALGTLIGGKLFSK